MEAKEAGGRGEEKEVLRFGIGQGIVHTCSSAWVPVRRERESEWTVREKKACSCLWLSERKSDGGGGGEDGG